MAIVWMCCARVAVCLATLMCQRPGQGVDAGRQRVSLVLSPSRASYAAGSVNGLRLATLAGQLAVKRQAEAVVDACICRGRGHLSTVLPSKWRNSVVSCAKAE